jgi:hypothetical protein
VVYTPRHVTARRNPSLGARALVGGIALGALGFGVAHSLHVTSEISRPSRRATSQSVIKQESCLRQQVRELVPKGASVYLAGPVGNSLLLEQFIAAWAVPASSAKDSSMTLTLVAGRAGGCRGAYIRTSPP